jgi:DnaD/phage-associated family protein
VNSQPFPGFPDKARLVPLPSLLFTSLLPKITDLAELKIALYLFWRMSWKKGQPKFISYHELATDKTLLKVIGNFDQPANVLNQALEAAVSDGILLQIDLKREDDHWEKLFFINTQTNQEFIGRVKKEEISFKGEVVQEEPFGLEPLRAKPCPEEEITNIFTLYEQNIGLLTPMIADELAEAEKLYPASWIVEAFKEAVKLNKRNWKYIARILERWSAEGKYAGKHRRDSTKEERLTHYLKGKYGHLVQH